MKATVAILLQNLSLFRMSIIDDYAKNGSEEHFTTMHCVRITNL